MKGARRSRDLILEERVRLPGEFFRGTKSGGEAFVIGALGQ